MDNRTLENLALRDDFATIIRERIPLLDVRSPCEFAEGAFPAAVNLPLLDDEQRHRVGIAYKQQGQKAAINLGQRLVSGDLRLRRIEAWIDFVIDHPDALLYCFRGGLRSKTAQQWIYEHAGLTVARLAGGYKALRRFLLEVLEPHNIAASPTILAGRTGTGKTLLLGRLNNSIDLEGLAHHRGSAFGAYLSPQPSQIDFENALAAALLQHAARGCRYLVVEDEGSYIGARHLPHPLAAFFKRESMVLLESGMQDRVSLTWREYVVEAQREWCGFLGDQEGLQGWYDQTIKRLKRIGKRLGGERLQRVQKALDVAHMQQLETGVAHGHRKWVEILLREYYDPMYDYQMKKSGRRVEFCGKFTEVEDYLLNLG
ncbi:unnamed protein product [Cyprideis torosa]|uniref:Uncharacterized protein n=1 Tax=Cyprideis torosa TaxID=163714 RepID=A0A7R8WJF9_9CRUS|nr:unnamed protein product [Cyprideis torosa]CAG0901964.1 unnamed protein product [Cyprideis torosa]